MTGRTHLTIGIATGLALASGLDAAPRDMGIIVLIAIFGSLLPDADHPQSLISGWIPGMGAVSLFFRHRGFTHSISFIFTFTVLLAFGFRAALGTDFPQHLAAALLLGMLSHLIADMLTPFGVPLLLPFSGRAFKLAPGIVLRLIKWTGLESLVFVGSLAVIGYILFVL